jgi:hypothetical protein
VRRRSGSPATLAGIASAPTYPSHPDWYPDSAASKPDASEAAAVEAASSRLAPKPSARVNVVSVPTGTCAVCTMLPPVLAVSYGFASEWFAAMSRYPSLSVPL